MSMGISLRCTKLSPKINISSTSGEFLVQAHQFSSNTVWELIWRNGYSIHLTSLQHLCWSKLVMMFGWEIAVVLGSARAIWFTIIWLICNIGTTLGKRWVPTILPRLSTLFWTTSYDNLSYIGHSQGVTQINPCRSFSQTWLFQGEVELSHLFGSTRYFVLLGKSSLQIGSKKYNHGFHHQCCRKVCTLQLWSHSFSIVI